MDFTKFSAQELGKAYEEIVGHNPFDDDECITKEDVSRLMNEWDEAAKGTATPEFSDYFKDGPVDKSGPYLRYRDDGGCEQ